MTNRTINISTIADNILAVDAPCEPGVDVRALLVFGNDFTLLVDTLVRPADLQGVREAVADRGRPLILANSHADWDHWFGNAAFPYAPIVAHRLTQQRQQLEGRRTLSALQRKDPETFAGIVLRRATIGFEGQLELDLGGLHVELSLLPGHTHDSVVAYVPERQLLFAGDAAEDPIPAVIEGPIAGWPEQLLQWSQRVQIVVPAHGAVSGPELLERNAAYLQALLTDPDRDVPELADAADFYRQTHAANLERATQEREDSETS